MGTAPALYPAGRFFSCSCKRPILADTQQEHPAGNPFVADTQQEHPAGSHTFFGWDCSKTPSRTILTTQQEIKTPSRKSIFPLEIEITRDHGIPYGVTQQEISKPKKFSKEKQCFRPNTQEHPAGTPSRNTQFLQEFTPQIGPKHPAGNILTPSRKADTQRET